MALLGVAGATVKVAAIYGSLRKGSYNRGLIGSAPLKNAMDWGSRPPNVWGGKATGIVSAGGLLGGARGQFHLRQIGIFIDLHFLNKPEFFLNAFEPPPKFNPLNGDLIDEDVKLKLKQILLSLKAFTLQLHHNN